MTRTLPRRCSQRSLVSSTINAGLVLAALVPGVLRPLPAQVLRGRIVEAETARPVPGALVLLVGESDSASLGRTMTSDVGRFELPAPREGTYRLRVLRIGHQAWMSAAMEVLSVGREVQLAVPALPFTLEEISVTEKPQCALEVASSSGAGALLEEAWKAFTLTEQTLGRSELVFEVLLSYRATDQRGNLTSERGARRVGRGSWPVISINPESLEVAGFVQPRDTIQGPIYFGPDPRVLFSEPFLRTHCFRVIRSAQDSTGLVGLAFQPTKHRKLPDIEGAMWLEPKSSELRRLEYRYTRLWAWVPKGSAGGEIAFERLAKGGWVVSRWSLRAPVAETRPRYGDRPDPNEYRFFGAGRVSFHGTREEGGAVLMVRSAEGDTLWRASP